MMIRVYLSIIFLSFTIALTSQGALNFDGINDYVQTSYGGVLGNSPRTIEAWIKTSKPAGVQQSIVDYGEFNSPNGRRFTLNILGNPAVLRAEIRGWGVNGTTVLNDGVWHHVAVTYDGTSIRLYVDCVLEATAVPSTTVNTTTSTSLPPGVRIGNRSNISSTYTSYFEGDIDEVRFWNVARSASDLSTNKNGELTLISSNLTGYWKLNEASGVIASDGSFGANNGTLNNFALNGTGISDWTASSALPVEMGSFTAESRGQAIELAWMTLSEINNDGFEIERSSNGSNFERIAFERGNGTTNKKMEYSFTDRSPFTGINYYRLRQIDYDGQYSYSETVAARVGTSSNAEITLFPNPVVENLHIYSEVKEAKANMFNSLGETVHSFNLNANLTVLDMSPFPSGQYILVISNNEERITKRFLK